MVIVPLSINYSLVDFWACAAGLLLVLSHCINADIDWKCHVKLVSWSTLLNGSNLTCCSDEITPVKEKALFLYAEPIAANVLKNSGLVSFFFFWCISKDPKTSGRQKIGGCFPFETDVSGSFCQWTSSPALSHPHRWDVAIVHTLAI